MMRGNTSLLILLLVIALIIFAAYALSNRSYYSHDHPVLNLVRSNFTKIDPAYKDIPLQEGDSSYTENKAVITLCIKDPETKRYYDMNTIMYVALHELGHMVTKSHGHQDEFKDKFATLLKKAAIIGVYDPRLPIPETYCGIGPD